MDRAEAWRAIAAQRLGLAGLLERLPAADWERPSLCAGWRVRDVVAHLTLAPEVSTPTMVAELVRARGNFDRMVYDTARRKADRPTAQLVAELRAAAGSRRLAPFTTHREPLHDTLVHGQDIAIPLGLDWHMPPDAARAGADRVWSMPLDFPFRARRRLRGFRLTATDVPWTRGEGTPVAAPIEAILLLLAGRTAALHRLTGAGAAELRRRAETESGPARP